MDMQTFYTVAGFILSLLVNAFGLIKYIDSKFKDQESSLTSVITEHKKDNDAVHSIMWNRIDKHKEDSNITFVRKDVQEKEEEYKEKLLAQKFINLNDMCEVNFKDLRDRIDLLVKIEEKRNLINPH